MRIVINPKHSLIACVGLTIIGILWLIVVSSKPRPAPQLNEKARLDKAADELRTELSKLTAEERVVHLVARLPEVRGDQYLLPGHCELIGCGAGTVISDALVAVGRSAMPALVEHLDDVRPTKSKDAESDRELLVQDVVIQCIERIVGIRFHSSSSDPHLSNKQPEVSRSVIQDIKDWWTEYGGKSELEGYLGRLNKGDFHQRQAMLGTIEKLDASAVDSIALLKEWNLTAHWSVKPRVADALARRGDLSALPEMRATVRDPIRTIPNEAVWFLVKYGDADDLRFMHAAALREIASGANLGTTRIWAAVYSGAMAHPRPLVVPFLVDLLKQRQLIGFEVADNCLGALGILIAHDEGRGGEAIDRWLAWWDREGREDFLRQHPEVADAMLVAWRAATPADIAELPLVVELEDPQDMSPITYRVSRNKIAALQQADMLQVLRDDGQTRLRLKTAEATAKALAPEANESPPPSMVVKIRGEAFPDSLGRMWSRWDVAGAIPAVFDGHRWQTFPEATGKTDLGEPGGYFAAIPGVLGAMIFQDDRARFHLFDAHGWVMAQSAETLATQFPDRLLDALDSPPRPSLGRSYHLIKDAKGRIWWAGWPQAGMPWGVVVGGEPIRADATSLQDGPQEKLSLAVLYPIGDGTKMLAVDEQCVGCVVDVHDGRIVSVEPSPVVVGNYGNGSGWGHNVLRDHMGRVWIMTSRRSEHSFFVGHGGRSQCLDTDGELLATHDGWLMLEDREYGLWFMLVDSSPLESAVVRHDSSGQITRLEIPGLRGWLAEGPGETVWAMTSQELIQLNHSEQRLDIVARHALPDKVRDGVWCDPFGGVWFTRNLASASLHLRVQELIRVSTNIVRDPEQ